MNEEFIYNGSLINVKEFCSLFLWLCQKISISRCNRDVLLDFLRCLLPYDCKIPSSYYKILKMKKISKPKIKTICPACSVLLDNAKSEHYCQLSKNTPTTISAEFVEFDVVEQLKFIIKSEWQTIQQYQRKHTKYNCRYILS